MEKFKVGDRVQFKTWEEMEKEYGADSFCVHCKPCFTIYMKHLCGTLATIREIKGNEIKLNKFHNNIGETDWIYSTYMVKLANSDKIIFNDNKTTLISNGKEYTAICKSDDKFDKITGVMIAKLKQQGITYGEIERLVKDSETKDNAVREVHRVAKVGEYIKLISNTGFYFDSIGDILKVDSVSGSGSVIYVLGKNHLRQTGYDSVLWKYCTNEYVVLENYKPNKITLTEKEIKTLKYLQEQRYKYIARDYFGNLLYAYKMKPVKDNIDCYTITNLNCTKKDR